jgi:phage gp36-like protein
MPYITQTELEDLALPPGAQAALDVPTIEAIIARASKEADAYLRARYTLPLLAWDGDLKGWVADIAAFLCIKRIGANPEADDYKVFKASHDEAHAKLKLVAQRLAHPNIQDSAKLTRVPRMASLPLRRW